MKMSLWISAILLTALLGLRTFGQSPNTGAILVNVADQNGAVIPGSFCHRDQRECSR